MKRKYLEVIFTNQNGKKQRMKIKHFLEEMSLEDLQEDFQKMADEGVIMDIKDPERKNIYDVEVHYVTK